MEILWLLAIVLTLVIGFFYYKKGKEKSKPTQQSDQAKDSDPIEKLIALNLRIRKSGIQAEITEKAETVVDQLIAILPKINQQNMPGSDLSWTVQRIAEEYLPNKCLNPYIKLSYDARGEAKNIDAVMTSLVLLENELNDVARASERRDQAELNAKAKFLQQRFDSDGE